MKITDAFVQLLIGSLCWLILFLSALLIAKDLAGPLITGAFVLVASYIAWVSVQRQIGIAGERHKEKIAGLNKTIYSALRNLPGTLRQLLQQSTPQASAR
jgi:hypothetical protein